MDVVGKYLFTTSNFKPGKYNSMASPKTTSNVTVARVISPLVQLQVAGSRGEMGELTGAVDM